MRPTWSSIETRRQAVGGRRDPGRARRRRAGHADGGARREGLPGTAARWTKSARTWSTRSAEPGPRAAGSPSGRSGGTPARLRRMSLSDFIARLPKAELHVHHGVGVAPGWSPSWPSGIPGPSPATRRAAPVLRVPRLRALRRGLPRGRGPGAHPDDIRYLTHEIGREMATGQGLRTPVLTCTPYTSVLPHDEGRGCRSRRTPRPSRRPAGRRARLRPRAALDLRHPGRVRVPSADATLATRSTTGPRAWSGSASADRELGVPRPQFQPHFDAARAAGCAASCTRVRPPARRRCGMHCGCWAPSGSGTARPPRRTRPARAPRRDQAYPWRSARRRTSPPGGRLARGAPIRPSATPGSITVNSDDPPMFNTTLNREYEIAAELRSRRGRGGGARPRQCPGVVRRDDLKQRLLAEIDAYEADPGHQGPEMS